MKKKITVCVGSSCHVKGSKAVVDKLQSLIKEHDVSDKVELGGVFCLGKCRDGVCVESDGVVFSLTADNTEEFFVREVLNKLK